MVSAGTRGSSATGGNGGAGHGMGTIGIVVLEIALELDGGRGCIIVVVVVAPPAAGGGGGGGPL